MKTILVLLLWLLTVKLWLQTVNLTFDQDIDGLTWLFAACKTPLVLLTVCIIATVNILIDQDKKFKKFKKKF